MNEKQSGDEESLDARMMWRAVDWPQASDELVTALFLRVPLSAFLLLRWQRAETEIQMKEGEQFHWRGKGCKVVILFSESVNCDGGRERRLNLPEGKLWDKIANTLASSGKGNHKFEEVDEFVGIFPRGEVHKVPRDSVTQGGAGLHRHLAGSGAKRRAFLHGKAT